MHYVMSLSGGIASAVAAERAIRRYGRAAVTLWFADTLWEDEDLYRFILDLERRWGGEIIRHVDGCTPLQVAERQHLIPNARVAPCSKELKIKPFRRWLRQQPRPLTVLLGLDWREQHRMAAPSRAYTSEGVAVDFPLLWQPYEWRPYSEVVRGWGIVAPRLYDLGFKHNNCGGRCVRQGIGEWKRLQREFPERFAEVRDWEAAQRAKGEPWGNHAILRDRTGGVWRPLPLGEINDRTAVIDAATGDDLFSCFCSVA